MTNFCNVPIGTKVVDPDGIKGTIIANDLDNPLRIAVRWRGKLEWIESYTLDGRLGRSFIEPWVKLPPVEIKAWAVVSKNNCELQSVHRKKEFAETSISNLVTPSRCFIVELSTEVPRDE